MVGSTVLTIEFYIWNAIWRLADFKLSHIDDSICAVDVYCTRVQSGGELGLSIEAASVGVPQETGALSCPTDVRHVLLGGVLQSD